jgi:uncharacterized protein with FMN-binding domain
MHQPDRRLTAALTAAVTALGAGTPFVPVASAKRVTTHRYVGSLVTNRFGENRVVIYVRGKRITSVRYSLPADRPRSQRINEQAGPILRSEALRAQSAHIHVVSGATYSSDAFAQSLQAALNRAHIR